MRFRTLLLASAILAGAQGFAQSNYSGFNYQAVIRNTAGDLVPNQLVGVRVVIALGLSNGYSERHTVTTDNMGMITLVMGEGTPETGSAIPTFSNLDWTNGDLMSFSVYVDIAGGTNYVGIGGGNFHAVPFAMRALSSGGTGWAPNGNDLSNTNSGNVGIGTTAPFVKLQVEANSPEVVASFRNTDPNGASKIEFYDDVQPQYPFLSIGKGNSGTGALPGSSHISSVNRLTLGTQGNPNLVIEPTGEMGFNAPAAPFTTATFGGSGRSLSLLTGSGADIVWDGGSTGEVILKNTGAMSGATAFQNASNASLLTIRNTGNVGIGTTSPADKLTVRTAPSNYGVTHTDGTITVGSYVGGSSGGGWLGTKSNHKLHFFTNNAAAQMTLLTDGSVGIGTTTPAQKLDVAGSIQCAGHLVFNAANGVLNYGPGGSLHIRSLAVQGNIGSYTDRIVVTGNGLVGIGTVNPQSALAVNGKITCKEVEVTLTGFPDYVFEKDYHLMPLAEVEAYIAANGHLPNVPNACEVEENGLGLGEMNKILLEKVEELTLHAIAKEKEVEALKREMAERIARLEAMMGQYR